MKIQDYNIELIKVHDGDTITVNIDVGFDISFKNQKIRLARINAPELKDPITKQLNPKGEQATEYLKSLLLNKKLVIRTASQKEKFGRWLCELYYVEDPKSDDPPEKRGIENLVNINDLMVSSGNAVVYFGCSLFGEIDN